jgi:hypothetical protein
MHAETERSPASTRQLLSAIVNTVSDPSEPLPHAHEAERLFAQAQDYEAHLQSLQTLAYALTRLERLHEAIEKLQKPWSWPASRRPPRRGSWSPTSPCSRARGT